MSAVEADVLGGVAGQLRLAGPLTAVTAPSFRSGAVTATITAFTFWTGPGT